MDALVQALASWVRQVLMAALLAAVVDLALPRGRFRHYGRLLLGLLLLAVLLKPVLVLAGSGPQGLARLLQQAAGQALSAASHPGATAAPPSSSAQASRLAQLTDRQVLDLYRSRLEEVALEAARSVPGVASASVRLGILSDPASPAFGRLESARVVVSPAGTASRSGQGGSSSAGAPGGSPPASPPGGGGGAGAGGPLRVPPVAPVRVAPVRVGSSPGGASGPAGGSGASGPGPGRTPATAAERRLAGAVRQAVAQALGLAPEQVEVRIAAGGDATDGAP
ncbi:MAG: stage III sporulation protein AF [Firmicutes bacterium]|nr:stage III sporulation protein AF [Bacillota bacterium]